MSLGRLLLALAFTGAAACSEAVTRTLDPLDGGGVVDGGARADAEVQSDAEPGLDARADGGVALDRVPPDLGLRDDAGESVCPVGPISVSFSASVMPEGPGVEQRIRGRARIESWLPRLVLVFENGQRVTIEGTLEGAPWPEPLLSPVVEGDVLIRRPFWTEVAFHLRSTLGARPFPIASVTGWAQSRSTIEVGPFQPSYFPSPCADRQSCGPASPMHLNAVLADGSAVFAPAGARSDVGAATVMNSSSSRMYLGEPTCEDAPGTWIAGMMIDRGI